MRKISWTVLIILFLIFTIQPCLDLDLGWHLRYGQYFFQTGQVLKDNTLSFFWPDYHWVQASWGYDLLLYQLFTHFGFLGISIAGSLFTLTIFGLITHPWKKKSVFELFLLAAIFLSQGISLYGAGLRTQTPSSLFFALMLILVYPSPKLGKWLILVMPGLFLLWANMHGGFSLWLILLSIIWTINGLLWLAKKTSWPKLSILPLNSWLILGASILLSWLAPLISPWGLRVYEETFKHATNTNLNYITEWQPLTQGLVETIAASLVILLVLVVAFRKKKTTDLPYLVALAIISYMSFTAIRFLIPFSIMVVYFLSQNIDYLRWRFMKKRLAVIVLWVALIFFPSWDLLTANHYFQKPYSNILTFNWSDYCKLLQDCSEEITALMLKDPPSGNGYHPYNYGGYLSWRMPQLKTFLDGRMAAWEDNGQIPPIGESGVILYEKNPFVFRSYDSQYHFQWVVIFTNSPVVKYLDQLAKTGAWQKKYSDSLFSYYVKSN